MENIEWFFIRRDYPEEIISFIQSLFEIYEIRGCVGESNGVFFQIRSGENNHSIPHLHAKYGEFEISIEISDNAKILAGKLPKNKLKEAREWVIENQAKLLGDWKHCTISATSHMTKSNLSM